MVDKFGRPRIIHQRVNPTPFLMRGLPHRDTIFVIGHVGLQNQGFRSCRFTICGNLLSTFSVAVIVDYHMATLRSEKACCCRTDSAAGASDYCNAIR